MSQAEELLATMSEELPSHEHAVVDVDKYFVIDPDTRAMSTVDDGYSEDQPIVIMQFDHNSEKFTFEVPRYVEGHDMLLCDVAKVHYNNIDNESGYENQGVHDMYDIQINPNDKDTIICTWLISRDATQLAGVLGFLVQYLCHDDDGVVVYEWHTDVYTNVVVNEGRNYGEASVSGYSDVLEEWRAKLFGAGDSVLGDIVYASKMQQSEISAAGAAQIDAINNKTAESLASIPEDYTDTYNLAKDASLTKADAIVCTVSGNQIVVDDSSDNKLRGLRLFGKTTQTSTTGAQLLDCRGGSAATGVTKTFVNDVLKVVGDGTLVYQSWSVKITDFVLNNPGKTLWFNYESIEFASEPDGTAVQLNVTKTDGTNEYIAFYHKNGSRYSYTIPDDTSVISSVAFSVYTSNYGSATMANSVTITKPMLQFGTEPLEYETYSGGYASPSPDWPQDLVHTSTPIIKVYSNNLCDLPDMEATQINGITWTYENGAIHVNGTATAASYVPPGTCPLELLPGRYMLLGGDNDVMVIVSKTNSLGKKQYITSKDGNGFSFLVESGDTLYLYGQVSNGKTVSNVVVYPQICAASADTSSSSSNNSAPYTKYNYQTYRLSRAVHVPGIPVPTNGNYVDVDGQNWVCDEIDFERGVYIRRLNTIALTGTEQIVNVSGDYAIPISVQAYDAADRVQCWCSAFPAKSRTEIGTMIKESGSLGVSANLGYLRFADTLHFPETDIARFTKMLVSQYESGNPVKVTYIRATPYEEEMDASELNWFASLHSNCPITTVTTTAPWLEMKYNADTKTYIDNGIKDTVAAVMEEIENGSY